MRFALAIATAATWSVAAFAAAPAQDVKTKQPAKPATISGCVEREADYRASHDQGKGGVAGTGVGVADEFVLTHASGTNPDRPSASPTADMTMSYELSGKAEGQLAAYIGKRVELTGVLKEQEIGATGPTGGPTATSVPGIDKINKDLKLREFEILSVKPAAGSCAK